MQYHILFSLDKNFVPYVFVAIQTLIDHLDPKKNNKEDSFVLHILVDETVSLPKLKQQTEEFSERTSSLVPFSFELHPVSKQSFEHFTPWREKATASSRSIYYRLLLADVLPQSLSKVLYLDLDIFINSDIRELFDSYPLENKILGAARDLLRYGTNADPKQVYLTSYKDHSRLAIPLDDYFNSGVLLINLQEWRKHDVTTKCLQLGADYNAPCHDQDLLNYVTKGFVEFIDCAWNCMTCNFYLTYNKEHKVYDTLACLPEPNTIVVTTPSATSFEQSMAHPKLLHLTPTKPWNAHSQIISLGLEEHYSVSLTTQARVFYDKWRSTAARLSDFQEDLHLTNTDTTEAWMQAFHEQTKQLKKIKKRQKILFILAGVLLLCNLLACLLFLVK